MFLRRVKSPLLVKKVIRRRNSVYGGVPSSRRSSLLQSPRRRRWRQFLICTYNYTFPSDLLCLPVCLRACRWKSESVPLETPSRTAKQKITHLFYVITCGGGRRLWRIIFRRNFGGRYTESETPFCPLDRRTKLDRRKLLAVKIEIGDPVFVIYYLRRFLNNSVTV